MSLKMRLTRLGAKKRPFYRVIVADSRSARDSKAIDVVGHYDPLKETDGLTLDTEKASKWLKNGAQPTDTVKQLLVKSGVIEKKN